MHLTEGRNTGFRKILNAPEKNGSPLLEFETDENHDYFITRLFVREGFYDYENVIENVIENNAPRMARFLSALPDKRHETASKIVERMFRNPKGTTSQIADEIGVSQRTIARYIKEFQEAGTLIRTGSDTSGEWHLQ